MARAGLDIYPAAQGPARAQQLRRPQRRGHQGRQRPHHRRSHPARHRPQLPPQPERQHRLLPRDCGPGRRRRLRRPHHLPAPRAGRQPRPQVWPPATPTTSCSTATPTRARAAPPWPCKPTPPSRPAAPPSASSAPPTPSTSWARETTLSVAWLLPMRRLRSVRHELSKPVTD